MNIEQIKDEIRKLNGLEKSDIYRWIDEESASDLLAKIEEAEWNPKRRRRLSPSSRNFDQAPDRKSGS
jgi:hypothetical protein